MTKGRPQNFPVCARKNDNINHTNFNNVDNDDVKFMCGTLHKLIVTSDDIVKAVHRMKFTAEPVIVPAFVVTAFRVWLYYWSTYSTLCCGQTAFLVSRKCLEFVHYLNRAIYCTFVRSTLEHCSV